MAKLTKTEQGLLALFDTKRNEDGRVQAFTYNERRAAWGLARKGLVRAEHCCQQTLWYGYCVPSICTGSHCVNIWKVN